MNAPVFSYRLPLSYLRVTGTRKTVVDRTDPAAPVTTVDRSAVVTTETGADPLTLLTVEISARSLATQKGTWSLLPDGRLSGADVASTVNHGASWKAALGAGARVAGLAAPLLAAGPPGWAAVAALSGAAAVGTELAVHRDAVRVFGSAPISDLVQGEQIEAEDNTPEPAADADPADWKVPAGYVAHDPGAAAALANYRAALAEGARLHAAAARTALLAGPDTAGYWERRVRYLQRMLAATSLAAVAAEAEYEAWRQRQLETTTDDVDERIRIDDLLDEAELRAWAAGPRVGRASWARVADTLCTVVSLDLLELRGDNGRESRIPFTGNPGDGKIYWRQPRRAVLKVWKLTTVDGSDPARYDLSLVQTQHVAVAYPGNEAGLVVNPGGEGANSVAATLDDSGALTKVTTDLTSAGLQRATELTDLMGTLTAAAQDGGSLRKALSPPSLSERADDLEAAQKLGLVPTAPDPLADLKKQLAEEQLRAQLRLAQQLASSDSLPVTVSVSAAAS